MRCNEIFEASGWTEIDDTGPPGRSTSDSMQPVNAAPVVISHGDVANEPPIIRYRRDAAAIEAVLPAPASGMTRLWRGNRPGEIGINPQFTNALAGIALPFRERYRGDISYVDVPTADLAEYGNLVGSARGAEFHVPMTIAAQARRVAVR